MCFIDLFFTNSVSVCGAVSFYPFEAWAIVYHYEVIVKTSHSPSDEPIIICGCCMQIFFRFFVCLVFFKPICLSLCIHIMFRLNEFQKPDSKNRKNFTNKILNPKNSSYECVSNYSMCAAVVWVIDDEFWFEFYELQIGFHFCCSSSYTKFVEPKFN